MLLKGKKRHTCSIYRTGIGFKKQQTNQREAKVTEIKTAVQIPHFLTQRL